jgi:hypothetical protein
VKRVHWTAKNQEGFLAKLVKALVVFIPKNQGFQTMALAQFRQVLGKLKYLDCWNKWVTRDLNPQPID